MYLILTSIIIGLIITIVSWTNIELNTYINNQKLLTLATSDLIISYFTVNQFELICVRKLDEECE